MFVDKIIVTAEVVRLYNIAATSVSRTNLHFSSEKSLPPPLTTASSAITARTLPRLPPRAPPPPPPPTVPSGSPPCGFPAGRMHQTAVPSAVWQRRTNKIIAAGITIIGLTMMLSLIPQCIYIGVVFVACALIWLGWMTMKEKKVEPPRPEEHPTSPVLFLVASHHLRQSSRGPTLPDPEDKPPSYDQILKLDGLPPDYYSILAEKPPRYEDLSPTLGWGACALPVELYTTELPCVHSSQSSPAGTPSGADVTLRPSESTSSSSAFLSELPSSWSAQSLLPPTYSAAQTLGFARENPSFEPVIVGRDAAAAAADRDDVLTPTETTSLSLTTPAAASFASFSEDEERQDLNRVTENVSHV